MELIGMGALIGIQALMNKEGTKSNLYGFKIFKAIAVLIRILSFELIGKDSPLNGQKFLRALTFFWGQLFTENFFQVTDVIVSNFELSHNRHLHHFVWSRFDLHLW